MYTHLLIFVNVYKKNSRSLFMLVHSALMFTKPTCDFNNALVNAEINLS